MNMHTHISLVGVDYNCGGNCHKNITFFNKSFSPNQNEPDDAIETTRPSFFDNKKFWTWAFDQLGLLLITDILLSILKGLP